jgi:hypothetical protein
MSLLPGGNPSGVVFAQDLQDPWSILHAYRESYILGVGQVEFRPCGADTRLSSAYIFPARMSGYFEGGRPE